MIRHFIDKVHRLLAKSSFIIHAVLLIRNQCNCIIKYYLSEDANSLRNGESILLNSMKEFTHNFVDVGANKGDYSELLLKINKNIKWGLLFEPSESCNVSLNQKFAHHQNIEIVKSAVSDCPGILDFFEENNSGETSSFIEEFSNKNASKVKINVTTLDLELTKRNIEQVDFLKIDTEGYDFHVLKGAKEYLKANKIGVVQFEYNTPWAYAGSTIFSALSFLKSNNYETYLLKSSGLHKLDYDKYGEFYTYANFISISPEFHAKIKGLIKGEI